VYLERICISNSTAEFVDCDTAGVDYFKPPRVLVNDRPTSELELRTLRPTNLAFAFFRRPPLKLR
jgi:hypothetical protein